MTHQPMDLPSPLGMKGGDIGDGAAIGGFPPPIVITKVARLRCKPRSPGVSPRSPKNRKPGGGTTHNSAPPRSFLTCKAPISKHFSDPRRGWHRDKVERAPSNPPNRSHTRNELAGPHPPHGVHGGEGVDSCMCPPNHPPLAFISIYRAFWFVFFQKQPFFFPICAGPRHVRAEDTQLGFGCGACAGDVGGTHPQA